MIKNFSIVVPVYNGEEYINQFFDALKGLDKYFEKGELIIVDNGSSESFKKTLIDKSEKISFIHIFSYKKLKSSYASRNFGANNANGKILCFTDFDCVITEQYLKYVHNLSHSEIELVSGKIELFHVKNNIYELFDKNAYLKQQEYANSKYAATANLITTKNIFDNLNGFKELISGGDNEFCKRATSNGYHIDYDPRFLIKHPMRGSYKEHIIKAIRLGKGHGQLIRVSSSKKIKIKLIMKNLLGVILPLHQFRIFCFIIKTEKISSYNFLRLLFLVWHVGIIQRLKILQYSIK